MPTPLTLDPGNWNSSVVAPYTLGALYETGGKVYRYVQLTDAVNATNGMVAEQASATGYIVTVNRTTGSALGRTPVGVLVGTVTAGNYCFMQVLGIHPTVLEAANSIAVTNYVRSHTTVDGDAIAGSSATLNIGWALATAAGGTVPVMLTLGC